MLKYLRAAIGLFPDKRTGKNTTYGIEDVALGAFSIFFTQCPSFLAFQIAMQKNTGLNNAKSLFGIQTIPSDNHIRDLMDEVKPSYIFPIFIYILQTGIICTFLMLPLPAGEGWGGGPKVQIVTVGSISLKT